VLSSRILESEAESSHQGQDSSRVSQPSRASFEEQLERFVVLVQGLTRVYQRCEHGCVETLRLATHIVASLGSEGFVVIVVPQEWSIQQLAYSVSDG